MAAAAARVVKVTLTHSSQPIVVEEKRIALGTTGEKLKAICASHFPTPPEYMKLTLKNPAGQVVESKIADDKMLGYYQCEDEFIIHVTDEQPASQQDNFADVSKVEKFEISEEEYVKRQDNIRAFKEKMIAQQREDMLKEGIEPPKELNDDSYKEKALSMEVGQRCQVFPGERIGCVKYIGRIPALKPGFWVGVQYDEPVGKNDGTAGKGVNAHRYFECPMNYGGFVRPDQVTVGDFPPEEF